MNTTTKIYLQLKLTPQEADSLFLKAIKAGLTIPELLEAFIADLTDSDRRNGSDEAEAAAYWYNRCDFYAFEDLSFMQWLAVNSRLEDVFEMLRILKDLEEEEKDAADDPELLEEIELQKADIGEILIDLYRDYFESVETAQDTETAMQPIRNALPQYIALRERGQLVI